MPETYGIPDPEPTPVDRAKAAITYAIAGQGILRRVVLYMAAGLLTITPLAPLAIVPLILLVATDKGLE